MGSDAPWIRCWRAGGVSRRGDPFAREAGSPAAFTRVAGTAVPGTRLTTHDHPGAAWHRRRRRDATQPEPAGATLPAAGPGRYSCRMEGPPDETGDAAARDGEPGDDSAGAKRGAGKLTAADVRPFLKPLAMLAAVGVSEYARRKRRQRKADAGRAGSGGGNGGGDGSCAYRTGDDP